MRALPAVIALLHLVVGLAAWSAGLDAGLVVPDSGSWEFFWQHLPVAQLQHNLPRALLYLHAQPPLHNLHGALWLTLFPRAPLAGLQAAHLALGALLCAAVVALLRQLTGSRLPAVTGGILLALHPALCWYEAYPLYTLPSAALLVFAAWALARWQATRRDRWLAAGLALVVLLMLTRSFYHPALLLVLLPACVVLAAPASRRAVALTGLLCCFPVAAWCLKNLVLFGFCGLSSWSGMNFWHGAATRYSPQARAALAQAGIIPDLVARVPAFSRPSVYAAAGVTVRTRVPELTRDDLHHAVMVPLGRLYGDAARALIIHDPAHYLRTALWSYKLYCLPAGSFRHFAAARARFPSWAAAEDLVHGAPLTRALAPRLGEDAGSLLVIVLPLALLLPLLAALRRAGVSPARWARLLRAHATLACIGGAVAYNALLGTFGECNDNMRFRFEVEPLLLVLLLTLGWRAAQAGRKPERSAAAMPDR